MTSEGAGREPEEGEGEEEETVSFECKTSGEVQLAAVTCI